MPLFNSSNPWRTQQPAPAPVPARSHSPRTAAPPRPRPPAPPADTRDDRTRALDHLALLRTRFHHLARTFHPPPAPALSFQPKATPDSPKLAFDSINAPVHAYEEGLTRLLTELDAVDSGGDPDVRAARKGLVKAVEGEAQRVERWRRQCFEASVRGEDGPEWDGPPEEAAAQTNGSAAGVSGAQPAVTRPGALALAPLRRRTFY
ncbi:BAG family molecular chaperone regulator [Rhodotorula paludigena]|uniref:BAG family molecular chaperone regulator n=1 Tax=Rhodotorula paludigena TaxID=86838 RepID=UPI00316DE52B